MKSELPHTILSFIISILWVLLISGSLLLLSKNSYADDYTWKVIQVHDGDTFTVDAKFFPTELGNMN